METYNGYVNYETWKLALNIDNSEGTQEYFKSFNGADEVKEAVTEFMEWDKENKVFKFMWDEWTIEQFNKINWEEVYESINAE